MAIPRNASSNTTTAGTPVIPRETHSASAARLTGPLSSRKPRSGYPGRHSLHHHPPGRRTAPVRATGQGRPAWLPAQPCRAVREGAESSPVVPALRRCAAWPG